ncbi:acyltransferase family protein [Tundrisphaera lichenicola]|uniref:acyltransferase family protein n=1 Tax=Tundrisphaera lichenicola TaxID=2029860 RepID=UPI003EBF090A
MLHKTQSSNDLAEAARHKTTEAKSHQVRGLSRIPTLDSVRAIACLLVLIVHLNAVRGLHGLPQIVGTAGVGIFFALSGFLITRILLQAEPSWKSFHAFYNRRVVRVFPIYYLLLFCLLMIRPAVELGWAASFSFNLLYVIGVTRQ